MDSAILDASYARLFGPSKDADAFFAAFYQKFLRDAEVARLFGKTDMDRQISMLKRSAFQLIYFHATNTPSSALEHIAEVHHRLGVPGHLYDHFLDCFAETVAERDPEADIVTELVWRLALTPGITYMKLWAEFHSE